MDPASIIGSYFRRSIGLPNAKQIASPAVIDGATTSMLTAANRLNTPRCDNADRLALRGKGFVGQRDLSQAYQEFLSRRPDFVQATSIDPVVYQGVIDKDESLDVLTWTLGLILQNGADGQNVLSAAQSQMEKTVMAVATAMMADPTLSPDKKRLLRVYFGGLLMALSSSKLKAAGQAQRRNRSANQLQSTLSTAQEEHAAQAQIAELFQAAQSGSAGSPGLAGSSGAGAVAVPVSVPAAGGSKNLPAHGSAPKGGRRSSGGSQAGTKKTPPKGKSGKKAKKPKVPSLGSGPTLH